jgi:hypothetical protein
MSFYSDAAAARIAGFFGSEYNKTIHMIYRYAMRHKHIEAPVMTTCYGSTGWGRYEYCTSDVTPHFERLTRAQQETLMQKLKKYLAETNPDSGQTSYSEDAHKRLHLIQVAFIQILEAVDKRNQASP